MYLHIFNGAPFDRNYFTLKFNVNNVLGRQYYSYWKRTMNDFRAQTSCVEISYDDFEVQRRK